MEIIATHYVARFCLLLLRHKFACFEFRQQKVQHESQKLQCSRYRLRWMLPLPLFVDNFAMCSGVSKSIKPFFVSCSLGAPCPTQFYGKNRRTYPKLISASCQMSFACRLNDVCLQFSRWGLTSKQCSFTPSSVGKEMQFILDWCFSRAGLPSVTVGAGFQAGTPPHPTPAPVKGMGNGGF